MSRLPVFLYLFIVMRILFDIRDPAFLTPSHPVPAGQPHTVCLKIPAECRAEKAALVSNLFRCELTRTGSDDGYDLFTGSFSIAAPGLYFFRFDVTDQNGSYELFREGRGTNIGVGEKWQLTALPASYAVPEEFRGAVYYQIFPDRFRKAGECDLTDKLGPYTVQEFSSFRPKTKNATDFAGGNFAGIIEKLDYIAALGTKVIYLNPVFLSWSNHRYDTGDYSRIDPMLGTEDDFVRLCREAHARGMKIILDGVFSHTGSHSIYFDADDHFGGGAVSLGPASEYFKWYKFDHFPDKYDCWWGVDVLPCVIETDPGYLAYITGPGGIVEKWLRLGADGYRLDVADELPDSFIAALRERVKAVKPQAVVIGEVWEDASNKISYETRRAYFSGGELDGVINYPFRKAILDFCAGRDDGTALRETVESLAEHYPPAALDATMAVLGTHDTERIGTMLPDPVARACAVFLQYTLPGSPVLYYGDEAGLCGGKDPMNRLPYPWGHEDRTLMKLYTDMGALKNRFAALRTGSVRFVHARGGVVRFVRRTAGEAVLCTVDRTSGEYSAVPVGEGDRYEI